MKTRIAGVGLAVLATLSLAASPASAAVTVLQATLTGAAVPGGGDPDAVGFAYAIIDDASGQICVLVFTQGTSPLIGAHIHQGGPGVVGPHAVDLITPTFTPGGAFSYTCTQEPPELLRSIAANPGGYYVNVHSTEFPGGALRGQLTAV